MRHDGRLELVDEELGVGGREGRVRRGDELLHPRPRQGRALARSTKNGNDVQADAMFVRMNPEEFVQRVSAQSLTPMPVDPAEVARAQLLFDDKMPRTYNIDLRSLTAERWSLEPPAGKTNKSAVARREARLQAE
jgi:hypothetical protein